jgi:c-di-GMP-binding flagellar brake protein YcgR
VIDERRQFERRPLRVDALVLSGSPVFTARTFDISSGGMGIIAGVNVTCGAAYDVEFALPLKAKGALPVRCAVKVVNAVFMGSEGGFRIGLVFTQIAPNMAQAIASYVR